MENQNYEAEFMFYFATNMSVNESDRTFVNNLGLKEAIELFNNSNSSNKLLGVEKGTSACDLVQSIDGVVKLSSDYTKMDFTDVNQIKVNVINILERDIIEPYTSLMTNNKEVIMQDTQVNISENKDVKELMQTLKDEKMDSQLNDLVSILDYVGKMENQLDRIVNELGAVKEQLSEMQENPIKAAIKATVQNLENKMNEAKECLDSVKETIADGAKQAMDAVKQKGISALSTALNFLHIKDGLTVVQEALSGAEKQLSRAVKELEQLDQKAQKPSILDDLSTKKEQIAAKVPVANDKPKSKDNTL